MVRFLAALLALMLAGCGSPFSDAPPVADSTFVSTLAELHLAEARLAIQHGDAERVPRSDSTAAPLPPAVRDSVLARHGLDYRQFRAALTYYVEHPEQYRALYARVVDTLNAEREALRYDGERPGPSPSERPVPDAFQ